MGFESINNDNMMKMYRTTSFEEPSTGKNDNSGNILSRPARLYVKYTHTYTHEYTLLGRLFLKYNTIDIDTGTSTGRHACDILRYLAQIKIKLTVKPIFYLS